MSQPITPSTNGVDIAAAVPTQRITPGGPLARRRDVRGRFTAPDQVATRSSAAGGSESGADLPRPVDRPGYSFDWREIPTTFPEPMPELAATLAEIPGGLGAELLESFTFAGQHWTAADADPFGTPIGAQLAMEQRALPESSIEDEGPTGHRRAVA